MRQTRVLIGIIGALMCMGTATASGIEVPGDNEEMGCIYFFVGWKCSQGELTGQIDGGTAFPLAGQVERPDTEAVCQNDGRNGWIAQYNFNRFDQATHTFEAFDGLVSFDTVTFEVVHFEEKFKTGATGSGTSTLSDGSTATLTWRHSLQAFVVTEATPGSWTGICTTKHAIARETTGSRTATFTIQNDAYDSEPRALFIFATDRNKQHNRFLGRT